MSTCDQCGSPDVVVNLCQACADKWAKAERHQCSFSSSYLGGGSASNATFHCRVCGEEWEKDVS